MATLNLKRITNELAGVRESENRAAIDENFQAVGAEVAAQAAAIAAVGEAVAISGIDIREFGNLSTTSDNSYTFAAAVAQAPNGSIVRLPAGFWPGDISIDRDFIGFIGAGKPAYAGGTLVGGTIIAGQFSAYAKGITAGRFGIDQSATTDTDGVVTGFGDETAYNRNNFFDIAILGRGYASGSTHGAIAQGGGDISFKRISVYKFGHGQVLRCQDGRIDGGYVADADLSSYIIKSADTFPANNASGSALRNCVARAETEGKRANLIIQGDTGGYMTNNVSCDGFWSYGSAEKAVQTIGTAGTVRDIVLQNMHIKGCTASRAFAFDGGANITGIGLNVYDGPAYSFGGDGASGVRLIGCTSREPTSGHKIGSFAYTQINGKVQLESSILYDDPALVIPAGALVDSPIDGGLEFDGTTLYFTVAGTRRVVVLT